MQISEPPSALLEGQAHKSRLHSTVLLTVAAVLVLALIPFVYAGTFSRFIADDYCSAQLLRENGFWQAQWISYTGWSNRFATMLATGLIDPLDVTGVRLLPAVLITGLLSALYGLLRKITARYGLGLSRTVSLLLGSLCVFFTLYTSPNLFQSFFWRSGNITYTLPVIGMCLLLSALVGQSRRPGPLWQAVLIGVGAFLLAGFSETTAALLAAVLSLGGVFLLLPKKVSTGPGYKRAWLAAGIGALAGLAVILVSPGNAVRMQAMPDHPAFFEWLSLSFRYAFDFLYEGVSGYILPRAVSVLLAFALALQQDWRAVRSGKLLILLAAGVGVLFLLTAACCAPSVYVQSAYPENRALTAANFLLTAFLIGAGYICGGLFQQLSLRVTRLSITRHAQAGLAVLLLLTAYIVYGGIQTVSRTGEYRRFALEWDARAQQINEMKVNGDLAPVVIALDSVAGLQELAGDPDTWVNQCAAGYYEVDSITAR